ncbi:hypothetical protein Tco_1520913, partial [Tanacetum coccineum]
MSIVRRILFAGGRAEVPVDVVCVGVLYAKRHRVFTKWCTDNVPVDVDSVGSLCTTRYNVFADQNCDKH